MKNNKIIKNLIGGIVIFIIFYFLGRSLFLNWDKIKDYDFAFNYYYLAFSLLVSSLNIFYIGWIWNGILAIFNKGNKLKNIDAAAITVYSNFGKYIPGKLWGVISVIYMGNKKLVSKKALAISYLFQTAIGVLCAIIIGTTFVFWVFGNLFEVFYYYILFVILLVIIIFIKPKIILQLLNFLLRKIKREPIQEGDFPSRKKLIRIFLLMGSTRFINGLAFYFLVKSISPIAFSAILGIIGIYILGNVSGFMAFFAPGGIGVKEGVLVLLLSFYFPVGVATLISVVARVWLLISDVLAFCLIIVIIKLKKVKCVESLESR